MGDGELNAMSCSVGEQLVRETGDIYEDNASHALRRRIEDKERVKGRVWPFGGVET